MARKPHSGPSRGRKSPRTASAVGVVAASSSLTCPLLSEAGVCDASSGI